MLLQRSGTALAVRSPVARMSEATCGKGRPGCRDQKVAHPGWCCRGYAATVIR